MQNMNREKHLETCLVIATGLLVIWFFKPVKGLIIAAAVVGFIGAFIPSLAKWINWFWYKLAEVMGFVMSKVLLSIVFYVFLFPIALIYRMTKKDTLQLKKKSDTYWTSRSHSYSSKDLEQVW
jgi:hypothetical protein